MRKFFIKIFHAAFSLIPRTQFLHYMGCRSAAHILGAVTDIIIIAHRADHLPPTFLEARYLMIYEIKDNVPSPDICNRVFGVALWLVQIDFCPEMNEWSQLLLLGCCLLFVQKSNFDLRGYFSISLFNHQ